MAKRSLNWKVIEQNLREAREALEQLELLVRDRDKRHEERLRVGLEHACHHINFAWNSRRVPVARVYKCAKKDFNKWSTFPKDLQMMKI